jgi:hypothetical protein
MVTQEMLEREIVKVKKAKAEHSGGERRRGFRRGLEMGSVPIRRFPKRRIQDALS